MFGGDLPASGDDDVDVEIPEAPVRPRLAVAIAGFAALLGLGLILGAQTSGPDARAPYAIVIFGVQLLFLLAWTMAVRPPAVKTVAVLGLLTAAAADVAAVSPATPGLGLLALVAIGGLLATLAGQAAAGPGRARIREGFGGTLVIGLGIVSFATLIVLTRKPIGAQAALICLAATGVALTVARLVDAVFARPRVALQVPRGATGIVLGAMLGTLVAAGLGSILVQPFSPGYGAVLGLVSAGVAGLVDLAVDYAEAGRSMAGEAPTLWVARHMQGPLGAFAATAPIAYALTVFVLP
jgi:hypothetical protein